MAALSNVVIPTEKELACTDKLLCTEPGCNSRFQGSSNLTMHLVKHHRLSSTLPIQCASYACPVTDCRHRLHTNKYFKSLKLLKQHYTKCHGLKAFKCNNCPKAFAKSYLCSAHMKSCGKIFTCACGWEYTSKEALLTHCKRKSHVPATELRNESSSFNNETVKLASDELLGVCITTSSKNDFTVNSSELTVFPTRYVAAIALSELATTFIIPKNCTTSAQTVSAAESKAYLKSKRHSKSTQETQTSKNQKISTETQTSNFLKITSYKKNPVSKKNRRQSTETQTKELMPFLAGVKDESMDSFSDSSLNGSGRRERKSSSLNDYSIWMKEASDFKPYSANVQSNTSAISNIQFDKLCNNETQTDIDSLFQSDSEGMSSAQTQTTDDLIEDLYSHMCTQTTDLFDFNLVDTSDNQTQTAWPDM